MARTAAEIRRENLFMVLRELSVRPEGSSRQELAERCALSSGTISTICSDLAAMGMVTEVDLIRSKVGRPTAKIALNPRRGLILGVDVAETYVEVDSYDSALNPLSRTHLPIAVGRRSPREVVDQIRHAITSEREKHPDPEWLGCGVSAPGQVDRAGGTSVHAHNWAWRDVPLVAMLEESIEVPLYLDNPLKALTKAELWSNSTRRGQTFVVLNLGTGVGAGIALDGQLYRGPTNSAGEWGHTTLVSNGRLCRCGARGCVEAYIGAPGIVQTLREVDPLSEMLSGNETETIAALARACAAPEGGELNEVAERALDQVAVHTGTAVASLVNFLNPEAVVFAGWVNQLLEPWLWDRAEPYFRATALPTPAQNVTFDAIGSHGNNVTYGVAVLALEGFVDTVADAYQ